jgi:hypothetical protein
MIAGWDELDFLFAFEAETGVKIRQGSITFPPSARWAGRLFPRRIEPGRVSRSDSPSGSFKCPTSCESKTE